MGETDRPKPWFFLSFAGRDAIGNPYIRAFFDELALAVGRAAGLASQVDNEEIGFFSEHIEAGVEWPPTLVEALQESRVLVCLCSPAYFNSPNCGRELDVFRQRALAYKKAHASDKLPPVIIPILWDVPFRIKSRVQTHFTDLDYTDSGYGDEYAARGVHNLLGLADIPEFTKVVESIAGQIVERAEKFDVPALPASPAFKDITSSFDQPVATTANPGTAPGPSVWFGFVAGQYAEFKGVRGDRRYYGSDGIDWRPYLSSDSRIVLAMAEEAADSEKMNLEILPVVPDLVQRIWDLEESGAIVVIIVDPWSIQLKRFHDELIAYDKNNFLHCAILVAWDESTETQSNHTVLKGKVEGTFFRIYSNNAAAYRHDSIDSATTLRDQLLKAINEVRRKMMNQKVISLAVSGGSDSIPGLSATRVSGTSPP